MAFTLNFKRKEGGRYLQFSKKKTYFFKKNQKKN